MIESPFLKLATSVLKKCPACSGLGQRKGYQQAPIGVYDTAKPFKGNVSSYLTVITRCDECLETGEMIDFHKWCQFKQNYPGHVIHEVEKIFDNFYHEVPL